MEDRPRRKLELIVASAVGVAAMLITGGLYRQWSAALARPAGAVSIQPGTLAKIPLEIEGWQGKDLPLSEAVVRQTDTDDHVNRVYVRRDGQAAVAVFAACGARARDLAPHRPEVCYPGNGWTFQTKEDQTLALAGGRSLRCKILYFSRSGLASQQVTVLNYYVIDGQYSPDVKLLRSQAWRGSKGVRYVAQVQITANKTPFISTETTRDIVMEFARAWAPLFDRRLPNVGPVGRGDNTSAAEE